MSSSAKFRKCNPAEVRVFGEYLSPDDDSLHPTEGLTRMRKKSFFNVVHNDLANYSHQFRYNLGTTEGEKEWPSGSQATPNEALDFLIAFFGTRRSVVQIHSPRPLPINPTT
jgi:hypothetical protein